MADSASSPQAAETSQESAAKDATVTPPTKTAPPTPPAVGTVVTPTAEAPEDKPPQLTEEEKKKEIITSLPFIVINRKNQTVTVDGVICLREGFLELFACGNGIRAHEALISLKGRPLNINLALILLGLTPGNPIMWTEKGEVLPPCGPVVKIFLEYQKDGKTVRVEAHEWLDDTTTGKPAKPQKWVYCGGTWRSGHFLADYEGTVVCTSNFPSAILDVPFESTDKNAELLFKPHTEAIPPLMTCKHCGHQFDEAVRIPAKETDPETGKPVDTTVPGCPKCKSTDIERTPVKMILQATGEVIKGKKVLWSLIIEKNGKMTLEGEPSSLEDLEAKLQKKDEYLKIIQVRADPDSPVKLSLQAMRLITKFSLEPQLVEQSPIEPNKPEGKTEGKPEAKP
jgi:rubredoxin